MKTKNILAGIKFRPDEIKQELAKGNKFIVKWKTIWKVFLILAALAIQDY